MIGKHIKIDHILTDKWQHSSMVDVLFFTGADCDTTTTTTITTAAAAAVILQKLEMFCTVIIHVCVV
jgi:hypothetical protein